MTDPERILAALADISARRQGSFAVVTVEADRNLYAQFLADGDAGLLVEIVGDEFLASADQLTGLQQADMRARGWTMEPGPNWSRVWPDDSDDEERGRIALAALDTLREVYGAAGDVEILVELEGASPGGGEPAAAVGGGVDAPQTASQRLVFVVAAIALLLALGIALFVASP